MGWTNLKIKAQVNHAARSPCNFTEVNEGALGFALIGLALLQTLLVRKLSPISPQTRDVQQLFDILHVCSPEFFQRTRFK